MRTSDKGPTVIRQKLRAKKIGENLIDAALEKYDQDRMVENATKLAEKQLKHYHKVPLKDAPTKGTPIVDDEGIQK
jgi:Uncharacterized protein conserved in bacteria